MVSASGKGTRISASNADYAERIRGIDAKPASGFRHQSSRQAKLFQLPPFRREPFSGLCSRQRLWSKQICE